VRALGASSEPVFARGFASLTKIFGEGGDGGDFFGVVVRRARGDDGAETNRAANREGVPESTDALVGVVNEVEKGSAQHGASRQF
jgi:hypothetical protein